MKQRLLGHSHWLLGTLVAAAGVIAARLTGDYPTEPASAVLHIAGLLAAGTGLYVIALGVRRRSVHDDE